MSIQNALRFIDQVIEDEKLYARVKSLEAGNLDQLLATAAEAGHPFDEEDWTKALEARGAAGKSGELDDRALEQVAGGTYSLQLPTALYSFSELTGKSACSKACSKCKKLEELGGSFSLDF